MAPSLQEKMENMKDNIKNKVDSKLLKVTGKPSSSSQASSTASPTSTSSHTTHSDAARKSSSSSSTSSAPTSIITKSATGPNRSSSTSSSKPLASLIAAAKGDTGPGHYSSTSNTTNINNTKISNVNETEVHIVNNYYTMKQPDGQVLTKTVPRLVTSTRSVKTTQTVTAPPITVTMSLGGGLKTFTLTSHAAYPTGGAHVGGLHFGKNRNKGALNNDSDLLASADPGAAKGLGKDDVASANSVMRVAASSAGWGGAPAATATSKAQSLAALWGVGDDDKADGDDKDDDAKEDGGASPTPAASASSSSASATATTSCGDTDINCLLAQLTASPTSTLSSSSSSSSAKATSTGLGKAGHETKKLLATKQHQSGISTGFIIAIVAFALAALLLIFGLIMACRRSGSRKRKNDNEWRRTPPQMTQQPASSVPYAYGGVGNSAQPPANYRTMSRSSMDQGPGQAPAISINVNGGGDPFHDRNAMGHARSGSSASRQTVPPIDENDYYRGPAARNEANGGGAPRWPDASRNQAPPAPGTQPSLRSLPYKTSTPQPLAPSHPTALPTLPVPQGGSAANSSLAAPHSRTSLPSFYSTASTNDEWNGRQDQMHPVPKIPQAYENRHDLA